MFQLSSYPSVHVGCFVLVSVLVRLVDTVIVSAFVLF